MMMIQAQIRKLKINVCLLMRRVPAPLLVKQKKLSGSLQDNQSSQHSDAGHGLQDAGSVMTEPESYDTSSVTPDLSEHKRSHAVSQQDIDNQIQECKTLLKDFQKFLLAVEGVDKVHLDDWCNQNTELLKQTDSPKTYIAVIGDTGAGKSSLLNALLDEEDLLPTSSMKACTASVVEVSCNLTNQKYEADIEFLSEEEWYKEIKTLIDELKNKDESENLTDYSSDSESIYLFRVKAVYGTIAEIEKLKRIRDVTKYLGTTKHITKEKVKKFCSKIEHFIEPSAKTSKRNKGGEYWPIVKQIRLRVPNAKVLKTGAVLVDLPGIKDSNPARESVAEEYLKTCDAVWVVSNIVRAVDDRTAKDMLSKHLRNQLYMDGHYERIAFICTKTDCYNTKDICRELSIEVQLKPLKEKNKELKKQINQVKTENKQLRSKLKECQNKKRDSRLDPDFDVSELQNTIQKNENTIQKNKNTICGLEKDVDINQQAIALECVKARNQFSKQQIHQTFGSGLLERRRAPNEDDGGVGRIDDAEISFSSEDNFSGASSKKDGKLHVFSVSATDYLKLRGKLETEGRPQVFNNVKDTEIPALKNFTIQTAMQHRILAKEKIIQNIASFIKGVGAYLTNHSLQGDKFQAQIREPVEFFLSNVQKMLQLEATEFIQNVEMNFHILIDKRVKVGVNQARKTCEKTARSWGSPEKPQSVQSKYPYHTYRAICVRHGVYSSRKYGSIDLSEELTEPLSTVIAKTWHCVFSKKLTSFLNSLKTNIVVKLNELFEEVISKLRGMNKSTKTVEDIQRQQKEAVEAELSMFIVELKTYVQIRQRQISRLRTPAVQNHMRPAFTECTKMRGPGCLQRMTAHMCSFVQHEKSEMFNSVEKILTEALRSFQNEICVRVEAKMKHLYKSLTLQFEPLLNVMKENKIYAAGLSKDETQELLCFYRRVRKICQRSNIEFILNDPRQEYEKYLPSTSGTVKSNTYTREPHFLQGTCGIINEDSTTSPKKYKSHAQTCQKEKSTVATAVPSLSSIPDKCKHSTSVGMSSDPSGQKRRPDSLQTPELSNKIRITAQGPQKSVLQASTTSCNLEIQCQANYSGGRSSSQTGLYPSINVTAEVSTQNETSNQRMRNDKFTVEENNILLDFLRCYGMSLLGRSGNRDTRNRIWDDVVKQVNEAGGKGRTTVACKKRVNDMRAQARKRALAIEDARKNGGPPPCPLTDNEQFLISLG